MPDLSRLNPAIRALESGKPAFVTFSPAEIGAAQSIGAAPYDGVVFEMEHNPYDIRALRDCMQYMLDRRQIVASGSIAPAVTPIVRDPLTESASSAAATVTVCAVAKLAGVKVRLAPPETEMSASPVPAVEATVTLAAGAEESRTE